LDIHGELTDSGVLVVSLSGQLDVEEAMQFARYLRDTDEHAYIIDMTRLTYIGSIGVGALVELQRRRKKKVVVVIPDEKSPVSLVVQTVNLGNIIPVVQTLGDAIRVAESA